MFRYALRAPLHKSPSAPALGIKGEFLPMHSLTMIVRAFLIPVSIAVTFSIGGCATQPADLSAVENVPIDRQLSKSYIVLPKAPHNLRVSRDSGLTGSACSIRLFVDGDPTADFRPEEVAYFLLTEGEHILSIKYNGLCGDGKLSEASITLKSKQIKNYRISTTLYGGIVIQPTAF